MILKWFPFVDLCLLGSVLSCLSSVLCCLSTLASCTRSDTSTMNCIEGGEFLFIFGDRAEFNWGLRFREWHDGASQLFSDFAFLLAGLTLAQFQVLLVFMNWEKDELVLVFLEALNIGLSWLNWLVAATSVNWNTDCASESSCKTSSLKHIVAS